MVTMNNSEQILTSFIPMVTKVKCVPCASIGISPMQSMGHPETTLGMHIQAAQECRGVYAAGANLKEWENGTDRRSFRVIHQVHSYEFLRQSRWHHTSKAHRSHQLSDALAFWLSLPLISFSPSLTLAI